MSKTAGAKRLEVLLTEYSFLIGPVVTHDLNDPRTVIFDFTDANPAVREIDPLNPGALGRYIFGAIKAAGAAVGIGRYNEDRILYRSGLFRDAGGARTVHLGIDIWTAAQTPVFAPLQGRVHSLGDNQGEGDYGPTVILEHQLDDVRFYTLYGHLARSTLKSLAEGVPLRRSQKFAAIGDAGENGGWPPHLHFQIITEMAGWRGDFPGVASADDRWRFLERCPDPNLILGIERLKTSGGGSNHEDTK
ncbi:MAG: peptidoglycan DD-metalloendopeptidase family protein [Acidobacteria bacterium]|jgi:murein DD-endopeptidase MepM/ murein hydrolase activator NlpD|nr:peptidoglycan DD-metalloendopeptidase family protein [Acidobacteriota bacterium]